MSMGGTMGGNAFVPIATGGKGVLAANQVQPVVRLRMKVAFTIMGMHWTKLIRELLKSFSMGGCSEKRENSFFCILRKLAPLGQIQFSLLGKL